MARGIDLLANFQALYFRSLLPSTRVQQLASFNTNNNWSNERFDINQSGDLDASDTDHNFIPRMERTSHGFSSNERLKKLNREKNQSDDTWSQ